MSEYHSEALDPHNHVKRLNELGADGWHLITVIPFQGQHLYLFGRSVRPSAPTQPAESEAETAPE